MSFGWIKGRQTLAGLLLAAMLGILAAEWHPLEWRLAAGLAGGAALSWLWRRKLPALLVLTVAAFALLHGLQFERNAGRLLAAELGDRRLLVEGEGMVSSIPVERNSGSREQVEISFELDVSRLKVSGLPPGAGSLRLLVAWPGAAPPYGSLVHFAASLTNILPPRNPGEFDYAAWLRRRQIFTLANIYLPRDAAVLRTGSPWSLVGLASRLRTWMEGRLALDLQDDPETAGVISAMVLGSTNDNLADLKLQLQQTGTLHLFAVSGLQVTMLGTMILLLLQTFRVPRRAAVLLTIPAILFYALITGWGASSVRAALMTSLFLVAILLDRPVFTLNTLAASALAILAGDTNQLFNTGFQLSFSVVAAILLLAGPAQRFLQKPVEPDPFLPRKLRTRGQRLRWRVGRTFAGTCGLTFAAWVGSMPLSAWYFHLFSPVALLANLVVVPVSFFILLLGVLSIGTSLAGNGLTVLFNNANWAVVQAMLWLIHLFAAAPAGFLHLGGRWIEFSREYRITVLDLGSGGSTIIEAPRHCWLIDTGSIANYERMVRPFLKSRGINHLDGIFLTHGDGGHVGGVLEAQKDFRVASIYLPGAGADSLVFRRLKIAGARRLEAGNRLLLDENAALEVLFPGKSSDRGRADDKALVLRLSALGKRVLLTSDSGFSTEADLAGNPAIACDFLVMGRNRDDLTGTDGFLDQVHPRVLICSAATFPTSEEVPPQWSRYCAAKGVAFFPQNETGAVEILIRAESCKAEGFLNRRRAILPQP